MNVAFPMESAAIGATNDPTTNDQLLSLIFQNTSDCLFLFQVGAGDRFTFAAVNDAFLKSAGFSRAEIVGRPIEDILPAANLDVARARYKTVVETGTPLRYEANVEFPAGLRYGEVTLSPVFSRERAVTHLLGVAKDVSDRKEAEVERARDAMLLANVRDSVIVTDAQGLVTYWNEGATRIFGWTPEEMIGRPYIDRFCDPDARSLMAERMKTHRESGWSMEWQSHRKDGSRVWIDARIVPLKDAAGRFMGLLGISHDMTSRKEAEEAVRRSERSLRVAIDAGEIGVWEWNILTGKVEWSDRVHEFYGMQPGEFDGSFEMFARHLHPEDADRAIAAVRASVEDGAPYRIEYRIVQKEGEVRWIYTVGAVVRDADGRAVRMVGATTDVTARKSAEIEIARITDEAQRLRRLYETILSGTPDFVYVFSLDYRVLYANESLIKMWGRSRADTIGKTFLELGYEQWHAEMHEREIDTVRATKRPIRGEVPFSGTSGRRIYDYIFVPVFGADGEVEAVAGTTRDVTDRKRAEEELRASEAEFRTTFENAGVGKAQATPEGRFVLVNPKLCELLGYTKDELVGMTIAEITHPDERERDRELFERMVRGETPHYAVEKRYVTKTGATKWVRVTATLLRGPNGEPRRASAVIEDITSRKEAEAALAEASRRKDEFLATLAHELRNPLAPIRTGLQILRNTDDAAATRKVLEMMERQLTHSVHLIDDLMDVSRITTGKFELRRERVLLQDVLSAAIESSRPMFEAAGHEFRPSISVEPLELEADQTRMAQVVTNLLTNAAKYTPEKGVITLRAFRDGGDGVVEVSDTGLGVPPNMLSEVFTMFTQVNRTLDRSQGGLGIGLALVKRLVEMHGGSITAASDGAGLGSTFTVRVPLALTTERSDARDHFERNAKQGGAFRVLVVDDNRDAADSLSTLLEMSGHAAVTAYNGRTAMELAGELKPDLVFLDLGMPEMNGFEVARRLRSVPEFGMTTLVALTGWGSPEDKRRTSEAGFDAHLTKPADADEIEQLLARVAQRRARNPEVHGSS